MDQSLETLQKIETRIDDIIASSIQNIPTENLDQYFLNSINSFMDETKNLENSTCQILQKSAKNIENITNSLNIIPIGLTSLKNAIHEQEKEKLCSRKKNLNNQSVIMNPAHPLI